jgi:hypothetical protein
MKGRAMAWLRFYGSPLKYSIFLAINIAVTIWTLIEGVDSLRAILLVIINMLSAYYVFILRRWWKQYRRWKFQLYGRGSEHSV